jgi:hypothetical protein
VRRSALLVGMLLAVAGCGGGDRESAPTSSVATTTTQATTAGPKLNPRCTEGTTTIADAIASGLKGKGRTLSSVYAVKSTAYGSVFLVSGRIQGAPSNPIGTWATNNLNLGGLMFSVDPVAKKFSRWADGGAFDPKLTMKIDGARASRACVKQASG